MELPRTSKYITFNGKEFKEVEKYREKEIDFDIIQLSNEEFKELAYILNTDINIDFVNLILNDDSLIDLPMNLDNLTLYEYIDNEIGETGIKIVGVLASMFENSSYFSLSAISNYMVSTQNNVENHEYHCEYALNIVYKYLYELVDSHNLTKSVRDITTLKVERYLN